MTDTQPVMRGCAPYLGPSDAAGAIDFYKKAFGAEEVSRMPADDGKRLMHAHLYINGGSLMMSDSFPEHVGLPADAPPEVPAAFLVHLQVDDADLWWNRAVDAGATVVLPLQTQFWGDRYGQLKDPFGVTWSIGQSAKPA